MTDRTHNSLDVASKWLQDEKKRKEDPSARSGMDVRVIYIVGFILLLAVLVWFVLVLYMRRYSQDQTARENTISCSGSLTKPSYDVMRTGCDDNGYSCSDDLSGSDYETDC